ncbi:ABC transporter substrate-binding protein [Nesterenkonia haasae]|uniref:ABC transporter substrate-binding protein n=1 Tax=Nesterenkonia haasae TaxID=2587813 RepID=UPI001391FFE0|nr:ABC transporter substrate-binding protein [Nesterenkonia haasae]NDK31266.1 nitrate ABC transporter substrate-binding protein [Nesterenkonia haasae]
MKKYPFITTATTAALVLTACGASANDTPGDDEAADETMTLNVGAVPVVDVAALYVGEDQGFFEDEGLELEIEFGQGSAAMIPALLNGEYDILYGGSINALQATDRDLPLQALAVGGRTTGVAGEDHGGVLAMPDSDIESPVDLEGRTVAVNALRGLHEAAIWASVRNDGGDPEEVNFVELALPEMGSALTGGQIDAASTAEPFLTVLQGEGAELITSLYVDADPEFVTAIYFTSAQRTEEDPESLLAFTRALERSFEYAEANPDAVRAELGNFTEIDEELLETIVLTRFDWGLTSDDLQLIADLAHDANSLDDPDASTEAISGWLDEHGEQ